MNKGAGGPHEVMSVGSQWKSGFMAGAFLQPEQAGDEAVAVYADEWVALAPVRVPFFTKANAGVVMRSRGNHRARILCPKGLALDQVLAQEFGV